jgi:hypothetical protein
VAEDEGAGSGRRHGDSVRGEAFLNQDSAVPPPFAKSAKEWGTRQTS